MKIRLSKFILFMLLSSLILTSCSKEKPEIERYEVTAPRNPEISEEVEADVEIEIEEVSDFVAKTIQDDAGNEVLIEREPTQVVIAGVSSFEDFLSSFIYTHQPVISYASIVVNYNPDDVLALEPNLIICNVNDSENYKYFQETGIPTIGITPIDDYVNDVIPTYNKWVTLLGEIYSLEEKAKDIIANSERIYGIIDELNVSKKAESVLFYNYEKYGDFRVEKGDYYGQFILNKANIINKVNANSDINTIEDIINLNSDVIYLSSKCAYSASEILELEKWAGTTSQFHTLPNGLENFSLNTPIAVLWFFSKAYPELFTEAQLTAEIEEYNKIYQ